MKCDVCIFGTGAAGLFLAERLTQRPGLRVVLVEAGPRDFRSRSEPYIVSSAPRQHDGVNAGRVTAFGGATNTWGGGLLRLSAPDIGVLAEASDAAWPLGYGELEAGYEEAERVLGITTPAGALDNELYDCGDFTFRQRLITILPFGRKNFGRTIGRELLASPNVAVLFGASRVAEVSASGRRINSLAVFAPGREPTRIEAGQYVIAAGVVNSNLLARRFLASADLLAASPSLGRFFHDHISLPLYSISPRSNAAFSRRFSYRFARSLMFGEHYEIGSPSSIGKPGGFFHFTFEFSTSHLLRSLKQGLEGLQLEGLGGLLRMPLRAVLGSVGPATRIALMRAINHRLFIPGEVRIQGALDLEQIPMVDWRLEQVDHGDGPDCRLTWDIDCRDVEIAARYALAAQALVYRLRRESEFDAQALFPDPRMRFADFESYVRRTATDTYHAAGGLRMGSDPSRSVVSPDLALHGLGNVSVLSTAVFPRSGAANPTLTLLALASRLARRLHGTACGSDIIP